MGIESNAEAERLLNNVKGTIENKIRAAYNLGYQQGKSDGVLALTEAIYPVDKFLVVVDEEIHVIRRGSTEVSIIRQATDRPWK